MEKVLELSSDEPDKAIIYLLGLIITVLCGVVVILWKDRKKEEIKNFNMLLKNLEYIKENSISFEGVKDKIDQLLRKYG